MTPLNDAQAAEVMETLEGLNEPERLGIVVAQAYGNALYERDQARAIAVALEQDLAKALRALRYAVEKWPETTWAQDTLVQENLKHVLDALESPETPDDPKVDR